MKVEEKYGEASKSENSMPPALSDGERQAKEDYEWCLTNPEIQKRHGGQVVVAFKQQIWGAGKSHLAAWKEATSKPGFPSTENVAIVYVPYPTGRI